MWDPREKQAYIFTCMFTWRLKNGSIVSYLFIFYFKVVLVRIVEFNPFCITSSEQLKTSLTLQFTCTSMSCKVCLKKDTQPTVLPCFCLVCDCDSGEWGGENIYGCGGWGQMGWCLGNTLPDLFSNYSPETRWVFFNNLYVGYISRQGQCDNV